MRPAARSVSCIGKDHFLGEIGWFADVLAAVPYALGWAWGKIVVAVHLMRGALKAGFEEATRRMK